MEDLSKLKIVDLKKKLKESGLICTGTKSELITRLQEHLKTNQSEETVLNEAELLGELDPTDAQKSPVSNVDEDLLLGDSISESKDEKEDTEEVKVAETPLINDKKDDEVNSKAVEEIEEPANKVQKIEDNTSVVNGKPKNAEITAEERLKMRAARFEAANGTSATVEDKKAERAKRFGLDVKSDEPVIVDIDKLKKREERFGVAVSETLKKDVEEDKKRKRAERFGVEKEISTNSDTVAKTNEDDVKKTQRAARFGLVSEGNDDKKKARAARFGLSS